MKLRPQRGGVGGLGVLTTEHEEGIVVRSVFRGR